MGKGLCWLLVFVGASVSLTATLNAQEPDTIYLGDDELLRLLGQLSAENTELRRSSETATKAHTEATQQYETLKQETDRRLKWLEDQNTSLSAALRTRKIAMFSVGFVIMAIILAWTVRPLRKHIRKTDTISLALYEKRYKIQIAYQCPLCPEKRPTREGIAQHVKGHPETLLSTEKEVLIPLGWFRGLTSRFPKI